MIVVAEVRREYARAGRGLAQQFDPAATRRNMVLRLPRRTMSRRLTFNCSRQVALPRTTSGKIMRGAARQAYLDKTLELLEASRTHAVV